MQVAAGAGKIEFIRSLRQPEAWPVFIIAVFCQTSSSKDGDGLIFKPVCVHLDYLLCFKLEDQDFRYRRFFFTRHLVSVCFQSGAGLGDGIDDPEILDLPCVCPCDRKLFRVPGPDDSDSFALVFILFFIDIRFASS